MGYDFMRYGRLSDLHLRAATRTLICLCLLTAAPRILWLHAGPAKEGVPQAKIEPRPVTLPIVDGADLHFSRPSITDELAQTKAGQIVQDRVPGFIWFGTQYGLHRFDGYDLKVFVHEEAQPNSLTGVFVTSLFTDRKGALWVGCDQFLNRFDATTETFTRYPIPFVTNISQDSEGLLWLAAGTGLYSLDPETARIHHYSHDGNDPFSLSSDDVKSTGEDSRGRFWVGTSEGLDEFERHTGKVLLHIPVREPSSILSFYEDREGVFWIFQVSSDALAVYDRTTNTLTHYWLREGASARGALTGVTAMVEDHSGELWIATHGAGLLKFDRAHRRFIRYRHDPQVPDSLPQDDVECLFVDHEGSIWAGLGSKGLTHFSATPPPFRWLPDGLGNPNSHGNPFVGAIYEDGQGTLWVGTPDALNCIDKFGNQSSYRNSESPGARLDAIAICEDGAHNIWVGTYGHGLLRFDPRTKRFKSYRHDSRSPYSISDDFVSRLLLDRKGVLWAAGSEALNRFDPTTERFTTFRPSAPNRSLFYLELVEDSHGALWLGTHSSGLQRFDPATGQFTNFYRHDLDRPGTLSDNRVNSIHFDHTGAMWVGTQNGLDKVDPTTGTISVFTRRNGLPGNAVGCVLEDNGKHLWLSTNNGIASFDGQTKQIQSYSTADGLPGPDLTGWGACFKTHSGELLFGGFSGGVRFFPETALDYPRVDGEGVRSVPVVLTEFRLSGHPVEIGHGSPLTKSISQTNQLTLSDDQASFSLVFSDLSYVNPATTRYRYRLQGLEETWHEVEADERLATYTTVAAGEYTFHVQAATRNGPWTVPGVVLGIRVLPPIWQTGWFLTACAAVLALSIWMLHLTRVRRLAQQYNLRLEDRVHERMRLARELHDTLLQSFQGLVLRLQAVYDLLPQGKAKDQLEQSLERADQAIAEGRNAVYDLRSSATVSNNLAEAVRALAEELATPESAAFSLVVEGPTRDLHPVVRDEVYRITREALRNAFRHARANHIETEITYGDQSFRLRIRDDGKGISPELLEDGRSGHYGLAGMRERARQIGGELEIWSGPRAGTEIELSIAGSIAYGAWKAGSFWGLSRNK